MSGLMPMSYTAISQTHIHRKVMEDNRIRSLASRKFNYILFYPRTEIYPVNYISSALRELLLFAYKLTFLCI